MNHGHGFPAIDQYDALIRCEAYGQAPARTVATAGAAGRAGVANPEVPQDWSPSRTRPWRPYPSVAI